MHLTELASCGARAGSEVPAGVVTVPTYRLLRVRDSACSRPGPATQETCCPDQGSTGSAAPDPGCEHIGRPCPSAQTWPVAQICGSLAALPPAGCRAGRECGRKRKDCSRGGQTACAAGLARRQRLPLFWERKEQNEACCHQAIKWKSNNPKDRKSN